MQIDLQLNELHPAQLEVWNNRKRFNRLCCGRRWGKTTFAQELLLGPEEDDNGALNGFPVAYYAPTYSMLMDVWREMLETCHEIVKAKSEQEKRIELVTGGILDFWSLDDIDSSRGRKYKRAIIDEAAKVRYLSQAWQKTIRPTLTDLVGDAWLLSTPRGKNNDFYEILQPDWSDFRMPTSSNPYILQSEIDEAERQIDPLSFAQEYLASFITENLTAWAYCYDHAKHVRPTTLNRDYDIKLSFDFNRNPITCLVVQDYGDINCIEQVKLNNSNIYDMCDYILAKYGGMLMTVTGDATGRASSALVQDNLNYYTIIRAKLNLSNRQMRVPAVNPRVEENRVLVNSILHTKPVNIDPVNCKGLVFDLEHAMVLADGSLDKTDRKDPTKQLDALDCWRYYLNTFHRSNLKL